MLITLRNSFLDSPVGRPGIVWSIRPLYRWVGVPCKTPMPTVVVTYLSYQEFEWVWEDLYERVMG